MEDKSIKRKMDSLGRILIPKGIRYNLNISSKDYMELFIDDHKIILKKHTPGCVFCGDFDNKTFYMGKHICAGCMEQLAQKKNL